MPKFSFLVNRLVKVPLNKQIFQNELEYIKLAAIYNGFSATDVNHTLKNVPIYGARKGTGPHFSTI